MKLVSCNVDETKDDVLFSWFVKLVHCDVDETNDDAMLSGVVKLSPFIISNLSGYVIVDVEVGELLSTIMLLWRVGLFHKANLEISYCSTVCIKKGKIGQIYTHFNQIPNNTSLG